MFVEPPTSEPHCICTCIVMYVNKICVNSVCLCKNNRFKKLFQISLSGLKKFTKTKKISSSTQTYTSPNSYITLIIRNCIPIHRDYCIHYSFVLDWNTFPWFGTPYTTNTQIETLENLQRRLKLLAFTDGVCPVKGID